MPTPSIQNLPSETTEPLIDTIPFTSPHHDTSALVSLDDTMLPSTTIATSEAIPPSSDTPSIDSEPNAPFNTYLRQSTLPKQPPAWHREFIISSQANQSPSTSSSIKGTRYPLSNFLSYSRFSPSHSIFLAAITNHIEPTSYAQAVLNTHWQQAMATELDALQLNSTSNLVPLPAEHTSIGCKWAYKIKYQANGAIE